MILKEILKWGYTIIYILGVPLLVWKISKGKHEETQKPSGSAIALLVNTFMVIGFWIYYF